MLLKPPTLVLESVSKRATRDQIRDRLIFLKRHFLTFLVIFHSFKSLQKLPILDRFGADFRDGMMTGAAAFCDFFTVSSVVRAFKSLFKMGRFKADLGDRFQKGFQIG